MASGAGQSAVVTSLLDHGADVHAVTEEVTVVLLLVYIHYVCAIFISEHIKKNFGT